MYGLTQYTNKQVHQHIQMAVHSERAALHEKQI
jgi:hypothetical protein